MCEVLNQQNVSISLSVIREGGTGRRDRGSREGRRGDQGGAAAEVGWRTVRGSSTWVNLVGSSDRQTGGIF
jgi:hypothetical protein